MSATDLDRVFHERGRLAICSTLVANPAGIAFTQLQEACALTDGNLNRHLHALAEEGIVATQRRTGAGRPQTIVRITDAGRERFLAYIDALEAIVREVQRSTSSSESPMRTVPARSTSQ
jgi:predicted ArsR family transcriptional regulator